MKKTFAAAVIFTMAAASALAQVPPPAPESPLTHFHDDGLLVRAQNEITRMHRHELDLLVDALATCHVTGLEQDEAVRRQCDRASARYRLAYASVRAIDKVFSALGLVTQITRLKGTLPPVGSPQRAQVVKDIERQVYLYGQLQRAISARNHELAR